jgi:L-ascorbate metabolism protein UlaG (beta-lactamase superfamily)
VADRITFLGHSAVRLELGGTTLLVDPLLRRRFLHVLRAAPPPAPETVVGVDGLLISHLHMDHLDFPSIRGLDRATPVLVPAGGERLLRRRGFRDVTGLVAGDGAVIGAVEIKAARADHDGRRWRYGPPVESLGFDLRAPAARVYFAGDTDLFDEMAALAGRVDLALLPIWGWGPRLPAGHLNPESAARAVALIEPAVAVPIHWGTMRSVGAKGADDPHAPARAFKEAVAAAAPGTEVRVLAAGDSTTLPSPDSDDAMPPAQS